jgi:deoxyinosine 3'endonuclease (endonuclease V)
MDFTATADCKGITGRTLAQYERIEPFSVPANARVAGTDVHYAIELACATIVVLQSEDWSVQEVVHAHGRAPVQYEYGFLAFRELPLFSKQRRG